MKFKKEFIGLDGFYWWFGVVEDRQDPMGLGRCRVRVFGVHTEVLTDIPSDHLPWAYPSHSVNNHTFSTPKEGEYVFGFYIDGKFAQQPVIMGIIPGFADNKQDKTKGFNDVRKVDIIQQAPKKLKERKYIKDGSGIKLTELTDYESLRYPNSEQYNKQTITGISRNNNLDSFAGTAVKARSDNRDLSVVTAAGIKWDEPKTAYNPKYPYNQVLETESGHVFELDDTPGNERVALSHRSGTFFEVHPSGTKVEKITKQNFQVVMSDDHIHIMGKAKITVDSDCFIKVVGDVKMEVMNNMDVKVSGTMNLSVKENFNIKVGQSLNVEVAQDTDLKNGGSIRAAAGKDINTNSGTSTNITAGAGLNLSAGSGTVSTAGGSFSIGGNLNVSGSTNLKAVGSDSDGDDHNLPVIGTGGFNAAKAAAAKVTGIASPASRETRNTGVPSAEVVPSKLDNPK